MTIDGKTIGAAGGGMLIGALITGLFLPMILKATLTDVATVAAREMAREVAVEVRPLIAQAIEDSKPNLADSKDKVDALLETGVEALRHKMIKSPQPLDF